ncbi:MAG: hydantoinase B/oxoprolinase family protein [Candidatus Competibacteraceae bacterium]
MAGAQRQANLADLQAQIAANEKGARELRRMVAHFGSDTVHAYMRHVQDNAAEQVRRALDRLSDGAFAYEMDNGAVIPGRHPPGPCPSHRSYRRHLAATAQQFQRAARGCV